MKYLRLAALVLFFVLLGSLLIHSLNSINQDIGRHLKSGQVIWETKNIYKTNLFSFTEPDQPFINHHWGSEVVFFLLNGLIGLKGLILFKTGVILAAFSVLFLAVRRQAGALPFLISAFIGIFVFMERTDIRPEIFSYLFLAFFLFAIFRAKYAGTTDAVKTSNVVNNKWLYALPVVQLFWTNMHIYFAVGPAILFLFLIDRYIHEKEKAKKVFKILLLTSLATLINPNFIKGALLPFTILGNYGYSIVENQSIFFLQNYGILLKNMQLFQISFVLLIISFVIALKYRNKKITFEALASIAFSLLAFKMIRNFTLYSMVFIPVAALNLSNLKSFKKKGVEVFIYLILIVSSIMVIKNTVNNNIYRWLGSSKQFGLVIPEGAQKGVDFIKQNNIKGPVFNNFDVGSFLIWKMFPDEKVFVDGRPEAYSVEFFEKTYKPMQEDPRVWERLSEEYKIDYVFFNYHDITPWAQSFLRHISKNPDWPLVYLDNSTAIFIKRTPENLELVRRFEIKN